MRCAVTLSVLALVVVLCAGSVPSFAVSHAQPPVAETNPGEHTAGLRMAEVRVGRPGFACPAPPGLERAVTVVVEVNVSAEGRLTRYHPQSPAPAPVLQALRQCLRDNYTRWEPARRAGVAVTHTWKAPFTYRVVDPEAVERTAAERAEVAAVLRSADACVQACDDPPRQYVLRADIAVGPDGRPSRVRAQGGPPPVNACAARCLRVLAFPVRDTELEVPLEVRARQATTAPPRLPPVPPPPAEVPAAAREFVRGQPLFACPTTRHTEIARLRGESRIRVTVSAEGRLVDFEVRGGTSPLRAFVRQCLAVNRDRWQPARDTFTGAPVEASWDTRYRFESQVWD